MATPKNIFQLVNIAGQNPIDVVFGDSNPSTNTWNYCDWDLTGNGHIRMISKQDATVQSSLKCVFTEKQDNGYGTSIYDLIGMKDIVVRRVSLFMDITMAILAMKGFLDSQAVAQDLSADDMLATMSQLSVVDDQNDPSITRIKMRLVSNSGVETAVGVV